MVEETAIITFMGCFMTELAKKETNENFFQNRGCQGKRTPYNAPPLTRNNGEQAGLSGEGERNKCLTPQRDSVVYAARAAEN